MPDATLHPAALQPAPPRDWRQAFAALPDESPPGDGWSRVSARLDAKPYHRRRPLWLAVAAAALLAVALPWQLRHAPEVGDTGTTADPATVLATATQDPLQPLHAESEQLESLLRLARDDRVASGTAAAMASELDARIASIDALLVQPGLSPAQQRRLWQARVDTLRTAAGFAGTRRWLVAHGERYDAALVQID